MHRHLSEPLATIYNEYYKFRYVLLLGYVMRGKSSQVLLATCPKALDDEYPEYAAKSELTLPGEKFRRVWQFRVFAILL